MFDGLITNFVHCEYSYLSVLSSSYCRPCSSPYSYGILAVFFTLGFNDGCLIVYVLPGLYGDNHGIIDSELYFTEHFHYSLMILWNVGRARWFFQFVFISGRHIMSFSYLMLMSIISRSVSPSSPRSSPFGFCNSSIVNPYSLCCILSPNGLFSSASMNVVSVVCSVYFFWVSIGFKFGGYIGC